MAGETNPLLGSRVRGLSDNDGMLALPLLGSECWVSRPLEPGRYSPATADGTGPTA